MVSLLLHGHTNISVTDIACSWSKKCAKENAEVMTIDDTSRKFSENSSLRKRYKLLRI